MELHTEFDVPVPPDEAFGVLTNLAQVAPCLPGAELTRVEGDDHHGTVKVKAGPIQVAYEGTARLIEADPGSRTGRIEASGREVRGSGSARADVRAQVVSADGGSRVSVVAALDITGRPAQFGSGVLEEVGRNIIEAFGQRLRERIETGDVHVGAGVGSDALAGTPNEDGAEPPGEGQAETLDLLALAGPAAAKRVLPIVALVGLVAMVWAVVRRRM